MTTAERDLQIRLQGEQIDRIERAMCELGRDLHGISTLEQLRASGRPALASLLEDRARATEEFETTMQARKLHHAG